jgi:hypothetical protein
MEVLVKYYIWIRLGVWVNISQSSHVGLGRNGLEPVSGRAMQVLAPQISN